MCINLTKKVSSKLTTTLTLHFVCLNLTLSVSKKLTRYKCLYSYQLGLSSHRYSVIFTTGSEIFAFSAMFRAEPAVFNFDISFHNWFSYEHFLTSLIQRWKLLASSKQANTMTKAKTSDFFSKLVLKRREIENFRITFNGLFWKILKIWFFRNLYFLLIPCQKTSYWKKKKVKNTKIPPAIGKKTLQELISMFSEFFCANM